jgi:hypothetical protein
MAESSSLKLNKEDFDYADHALIPSANLISTAKGFRL